MSPRPRVTTPSRRSCASTCGPDLARGVEAGLARAVLDQLDGGDQPEPADVADVRVRPERVAQALQQRAPSTPARAARPLALHDLDRRQRHRAHATGCPL